ncbi:DUF6545 domain-containing protein [Actinokineospora iranica]|uniref:DUF6545 domain-containing protein n=1 Tax=Actinokineospora iranica TaxID=1271860 RepID=A0A1G6VYF0_9PSEU|nr:DUF6545 domain-containing protein [Actinokineospora iranica]SDD57805.1 hypothetical protein SAMN05216174_113129 [Actinokineospora iranica]
MSAVIVIVSITLLMAGVLVPPIGTRWDAYRARRDLLPLWTLMTDLAPELVFGHRDLRALVTEIRDISIGPLRPYLDPRVDHHARTMAGAEHASAEARAIGQAAAIIVAIRAFRDGRPPLVARPPLIIGIPDQSEHPASEADEVDALVRIAKALPNPIVTHVVKELGHVHDHA